MQTAASESVRIRRSEDWPWAVRALLGCIVAMLASGVTYGMAPLRVFPLLFAFPTVILCAWYLGMWGAASSALTGVILINILLRRAEPHLTLEVLREEIRLTAYLLISVFLGWTIRKLSEQRMLLSNQELERQLVLANADRQVAEERARASEALREREQVLEVALQANGVGLWVMDLKNGSTDWSNETYRIAGREPGSVVPNPENWLKFVHPEDAEAVRQAFVPIVQAGGNYHQRYRIVLPNGAVRWVESQGKCQLDDAGRVSRIIGVVSDVTVRKAAEEAMVRAEKLAIAGRLAASVAHEINNPLEAVANLLYLAAHADTLPAAHTQAQQALEELMRVSLITQQTLKFHRQVGLPRNIKLSEVIESVLAMFRSKFKSAGIYVELRIQREVPISCMPGEVQQIFANLVSNAIDAMPNGGRLAIRLRPSTDWRNFTATGMRVTFIDSGVGMSPETRHRIFEPFFTTKGETGTGLGMWVVAQLAERQGGSVRLWSSQKSGKSATAVSLFLANGETPEYTTPDQAAAHLA